MYLIAATAQSLGHTLDDLAVNRWSIRQSRMIRLQASESGKEEFVFNLDSTVPLIVHWDGKLLPETAVDNKTYDRLPIIVSYEETEKFLSVPKLDNGPGESIANAVSEVLKDWKLEDQVVAMSFDTTNSNTGRYNGACKLIEKKTG